MTALEEDDVDPAGGVEHVPSDLDKGTTLGDADGPDVYVPEFDLTVPSFVNPRDDLISDHAKARFGKRLDHHVPFKMRGDFFPHDWPIEYYNQRRGGLRTSTTGHVLCHGMNGQGALCSARAVNRSLWCRNHGGALHPADKKLSGSTIAPIDPERVAKLDRVQQFMQGLLKPSDLDDDEIKGSFVRNDKGVPVRVVKLGAKFSAQIRKELHDRLNEYLLHETPDMLKIMTEIARNDLYEAADRIKAAQWVAEKTMGKAPEVLLHGTTDAPYVSILDNLTAGSREEYRQSIESSRIGSGGSDAAFEIIDAEIEPDDSEPFPEEEPEPEPDWEPEPEELEEQEEEPILVSAQHVQDANKEQAERAKEQAKRIKKAKQRRYAARAVGATSLTAIPWLVEYIPILDDDGEVVRHRMKVYRPDKQTPGLVDRLMAVENAKKLKDYQNQESDNGEQHG